MIHDTARALRNSVETSWPPRLNSADRREGLLDAAARIIAEGGIEAASMEAVADLAGVSRPLVYKHFGNRVALLGEVRRREALRLHGELASAVRSSPEVEGMFRTLVHAALRATDERGALFAALRSASGYSRELDQEQQERDRATTRFFGGRIVAEYGVDPQSAEIAAAVLLRGIDSILEQFRTDRSPAHADTLEATYLLLVRAGLQALPVPKGKPTKARSRNGQGGGSRAAR